MNSVPTVSRMDIAAKMAELREDALSLPPEPKPHEFTYRCLVYENGKLRVAMTGLSGLEAEVWITSYACYQLGFEPPSTARAFTECENPVDRSMREFLKGGSLRHG